MDNIVKFSQMKKDKAENLKDVHITIIDNPTFEVFRKYFIKKFMKNSSTKI